MLTSIICGSFSIRKLKKNNLQQFRRNIKHSVITNLSMADKLLKARLNKFFGKYKLIGNWVDLENKIKP